MPRSQWWLLCVTALAATACAPAAPPEPPEPPWLGLPAPTDPRAAARALAERGFALYEAGDYRQAAVEFFKAYRRFQAPTILLWQARTQEKLGRLREAHELYADIAREELGPDAPEGYHEAQQLAVAELAALEKRMPSVQIRVTGVPADEVWVMIDGEIAAAPGDRVMLDPGRHEITAEAPGRPIVRREVVLEGSATKWVWMTLGAPAAPTAAPARATTQRSPAEAAPVPASGPVVASPSEQ